MVNKLCRGIDVINERVAKITCWLILPLTFLVAVEVMLRYVFNRPTIWIWDVNVQINGVLIILGGGYALLQGAHIGVDVLVERLSLKKKAIVHILTYPLFIFSVGVLLWETSSAAWTSVSAQEKYNSFFMPPIYPFKVVMAIGVLLLFLQGVAKFIRELLVLISPKAQR